MSEVRREDIIVEDVGQQYISRPRMCYTSRPHQRTGCATEILSTAWSCFNYLECTT